MTIFLHELRRSRTALTVWSAAISFMLGVCVLIYPEMSTQMGDLSAMFSDMGAFSDAFGMDQLNFGEFMGYFGIECGNTLGLGGALFAAIVGASALAKEEREHTAEFLLTHPISRKRIISEKLLAVFAEVCVLNVAAIGVTCVGIALVGVEADAATLALLFLAHLILHLQIAAMTFGLSAFLRRGELGLGLGLVFALYFFNILANLSEELEFLKFITPFGYTDGAYIIPEKAWELPYLATGLAFAALGIAVAYWQYTRKDIV